MLFDQNRPMVVTGVAADVPSNAHFQFDFLAPMSIFLSQYGPQLDEWSTAEIYTYLRLSDTQARTTLASQFPAFVERHLGPGANQTYRLQTNTTMLSRLMTRVR